MCTRSLVLRLPNHGRAAASRKPAAATRRRRRESGSLEDGNDRVVLAAGRVERVRHRAVLERRVGPLPSSRDESVMRIVVFDEVDAAWSQEVRQMIKRRQDAFSRVAAVVDDHIEAFSKHVRMHRDECAKLSRVGRVGLEELHVAVLPRAQARQDGTVPRRRRQVDVEADDRPAPEELGPDGEALPPEDADAKHADRRGGEPMQVRVVEFAIRQQRVAARVRPAGPPRLPRHAARAQGAAARGDPGAFRLGGQLVDASPRLVDAGRKFVRERVHQASQVHRDAGGRVVAARRRRRRRHAVRDAVHDARRRTKEVVARQGGGRREGELEPFSCGPHG
mmetsp:Transcript_34283/g.105343  ORF Transcript_34283/g.105343 Transcript_34283/m.105343 type:complete len:336 (-) Transcript_34283:72-1079(-)